MADLQRFLIIEDDFLIGTCLKDYLSAEGFEVETATTCKVARHFIQSTFQFDAVTIDVSLPDGDGFALGREIAQQRPDIPIIYTTGHVIDTQTLSRQEGYISKPYLYESLLAEIKRVDQAIRASDKA